MYKDYYGLSEDPFSLTSDERYFYKSNAHLKSLAELEFGLSKGEGFVVVTGETGVGKSTLISYLQARLAAEPLVTGWLTMTRVSGDDLLRLVARAFNLAVDDPPPSKAKLLSQIETYFSKHASCLIVDEAQGLTDSGLEELRMLSNLRTGTEALLQIVLLGQPELRDRLVDKKFEPLRQRVMAYCFLPPFDASDTREYIAHRLKVAGWQGDPSLSSDALYRIYVESGGVPRKINLLCDRLFRHGCLREKHRLDKFDVFEVISDLGDDFFFAGSSSGKSDEADRAGIHPLLHPLDGADDSDAQAQNRPDSMAYALAGTAAAASAGFEARPAASGFDGGLHEGPVQPLRRSASAPDPEKRRSMDQARNQPGPEDETRIDSSTAAPVFSPKLTPRTEDDFTPRRTKSDVGNDDRTRLTAPMSSRSTSPYASSSDRNTGSRRLWRSAIIAVAGVAVLAGIFIGVKAFRGEPQRNQAVLSGLKAEQGQAGAARDELGELDTKTLSSMNPLMTRPDRAHVGSISDANAAKDGSAREAPGTVPAQEDRTPPDPSNAEVELSSVPRDTAPAPVAETSTVNDVETSDEVPTRPEPDSADVAAQTGSAADAVAEVEAPADSLSSETEPVETPVTAEPEAGGDVEAQTPEPVARPQTAETPPAVQPAMTPAAKPAVTPAATPELPPPLARAQLTTELRGREPVDHLRSPIALSALKGGRLNYFTEVIGFSGRTIEHRWLYQGQTVLNLRFPIGSDRWRVYTSKTIGQNKGPWQVVVTDGNGKELHREEFVIE